MFFSRQDYESNATMLDGYKIFDEMRSFPTHSSWIRKLYFASMDDHRVKIRCQEFEEESCDDAELESEISAEDFGQRFDVNGFSLTEYYKNEILPAKMRQRNKYFLDLRTGLRNAYGMVVYIGMKYIGAQLSRLDFSGRVKVEVAYSSKNITYVFATMINTDIGIQNAPLLRDPSCYGARVLSKRPSHSSYDQVKVMRSTRLLYPKEDNAYLEHDFTKQSCKLKRKLRETQMIFLDEEQKKRSLTHLQYTEEHYNMRSALYKKRDPINWKTIWRKDILKYQEALREEMSEGKISVPPQYERVLRQKIRYNLMI
ncbi:hypothetical protein DMENIID0001_006120 [Sergentomyia squamirostris]